MVEIPKDGPCPQCGRWHVRATTVDAVVIHRGQVLLMRRLEEPFVGFYALPGGYPEDDEDLPTAAAREAEEETLARVRKPRLIGVFGNPKRHPKHAVSIAYAFELASNPADVGIGNPVETSEVIWAPLDNLPPLAFDHGEIIATYLEKSWAQA